MSVLYYHACGRHIMDYEGVEALGLAYAFDGPAVTSRGTDKGPDGGKGVVFVAEDLGTIVRYQPEAQTWEPYAGKDGVWLGYYKDAPPGPDGLARPKQFAGHYVRLADGNEWQIPVLRVLNGTTPLPRRLRWDGSQWAPGDLLDRYKDLFGAACAIWDQLRVGNAGAITLTDEANVVCQALALNYRLGPAEISLLGLLNTDVEAKACLATLDWPTFLELKKKQDLEARTSQPGDGDSCPTTDQA